MKPRIALATLLLLLLLLLTSCTHLFYNPDHVIYYPPEKTGYVNQNLYFDSLDGTKLHAWFFPSTSAGKPKGTIVHFHGNARNITSMYMSLAWLTERGYNLFCFDYRGYGESQGVPDEEGTYKDGLAALNQAWQLHLRHDPKASKFVVYGHSLGGTIALRSFVDFGHQEATTLIVLDSTFLSYRDLAQQMMAGRWLTWPISPLARIFVSDRYAAAPALARLKTPLLVSHDRHDPLVPFDKGEEIFRNAKKKKWFWEKDEHDHAGMFSVDENEDRFIALLDSL